MLKRIWQALKRLASKPAARIAGSALALVVLLATVGIALLYIPRWQATQLPPFAKATERFEAENEARRTLAQILLGLGGIVALYAAWRRTRALEDNVRIGHKNVEIGQENVRIGYENIRVAQQGQITDRFSKAIEHCGASDNDGRPVLEIRLGGIYALERIAKEAPDDHWTVMEILTAYVRKNAAWKNTKEASSEVSDDTGETASDGPSALPEPRIDIQAILTVLGRRERDGVREQDHQLNLAATDLRRADLRTAHLEGANLLDAHLEGTDPSPEELDKAQGNSRTTLPDGLTHPPHWLGKDSS